MFAIDPPHRVASAAGHMRHAMKRSHNETSQRKAVIQPAHEPHTTGAWHRAKQRARTKGAWHRAKLWAASMTAVFTSYFTNRPAAKRASCSGQLPQRCAAVRRRPSLSIRWKRSCRRLFSAVACIRYCENRKQAPGLPPTKLPSTTYNFTDTILNSGMSAVK
jgi:hypothetical protein